MSWISFLQAARSYIGLHLIIPSLQHNYVELLLLAGPAPYTLTVQVSLMLGAYLPTPTRQSSRCQGQSVCAKFAPTAC